MWGWKHVENIMAWIFWWICLGLRLSQTVSHNIKYSTYLQPMQSRRNCCSSSHSWPRTEQMFCISVVRITFWKTKYSHSISSKQVIINAIFFSAELSKLPSKREKLKILGLNTFLITCPCIPRKDDISGKKYHYIM